MALDQWDPATEQLMMQLSSSLSSLKDVRFINNPVRTLRRFELLRELHRQNRNEFRAIRAGQDLCSLRYPVFLREERSHDGAISPLLKSSGEVEKAIGRALVQGHRLRDLLVIEFCNTADKEGFYRKYAAFVVGNKVIARSLNYGTHWMLKHEGTEFTQSMALEERKFVFENPHEEKLRKIFEIAGVEYGRIDYALKDSRIQTWEINLNPTIGRGLGATSGNVPAELEPIRTEVKQHFYRCFQDAWEAVDVTPTEDEAIRVSLDVSGVRSNRSSSARGPLLAAARALVRPAKSRLEPLAAPFLRLVGWCALRRNRICL